MSSNNQYRTPDAGNDGLTYSGEGIRWHMQSGTDGTRRQRRLRLPEAENIQAHFFKIEKVCVFEYLATTSSMMTETERMNRALRIGRCPRLIMAIVKTVQQQKLQESFTTVGISIPGHAAYVTVKI